jgi:hypothetical protein
MPPKTTVCSICNETVLKSTTRAVAEGERACKSHDGVLEQADQLVADEKGQRRQAEEEAKKNRRNRFRSSVFDDSHLAKQRDFVHNCCWSCGARGISQRDAILRSIAAMEKHKVTGEKPVNFLLGEHIDVVNKDLKREGKTILLPIPYEPRMDRKLKHDLGAVAHIVKQAQLCRECCNKYGFKAPEIKPPPKMDFDQMMSFGTILREELRELRGMVAREEEEK